jgi:hypothetical protein
VELHVGDRVVVDHMTAGGQPGATLPPELLMHPGPGGGGGARFRILWPDGTVQESPAREGRWHTVEQE